MLEIVVIKMVVAHILVVIIFGYVCFVRLSVISFILDLGPEFQLLTHSPSIVLALYLMEQFCHVFDSQ